MECGVEQYVLGDGTVTMTHCSAYCLAWLTGINNFPYWHAVLLAHDWAVS